MLITSLRLFRNYSTKAATLKKSSPLKDKLEDTFKLAKSIQFERLSEKEIQLLFIKAEINACSDEKQKLKLINEKNQLEKALKEGGVQLEEDLSNANESANLPFPLFSELSNEMFQKLHGPQLLKTSATYYKIQHDLFPKNYQIQNTQLLNLVVDYRNNNDSTATSKLFKENIEKVVYRGNIILPETTQQMPNIRFSTTSKSPFSVFLVDLDMPSTEQQTMIPTPLFFQANIKNGDLTTGESVLEYMPVHPQQGTGYHRYVWLLLEQSKDFKKEDIMNELQSQEWNMQKWLTQHQDDYKVRGFVFHRSCWTPSVTEMYQQGKIYEYNSGQRVKVENEPVYGYLLERDWQSVTQRLNRYAFR